MLKTKMMGISKGTTDIQKGFPWAKYERDYNPLNKRKTQVNPDNNEEINGAERWKRPNAYNKRIMNKMFYTYTMKYYLASKKNEF